MNKNRWYIIFDNYNTFKIIDLLCCKHAEAWEIANRYLVEDKGSHADVMRFDSKKDAIDYVNHQIQIGGD